jgi:hypothetical protein
MAADEKSTLKLFFDCRFHTLSLQASIASTHRHVHVQIVVLGSFLRYSWLFFFVLHFDFCFAPKKKSSPIYLGPNNLLCNGINWVSRNGEQRKIIKNNEEKNPKLPFNLIQNKVGYRSCFATGVKLEQFLWKSFDVLLVRQIILEIYIYMCLCILSIILKYAVDTCLWLYWKLTLNTHFLLDFIYVHDLTHLVDVVLPLKI